MEKVALILYSNKIDEYLKCDSVIDYDNEAIMEMCITGYGITHIHHLYLN